MNLGYTIYQAERPMSSAERRAADRRNGELAAALASRWQRVGAALSGGARNTGRRQAPALAGNPRAVLRECR